MRLNIVTNDALRVHDALIDLCENSAQGIKVYLANRPAKGIVEYDFVSSEPACISLENIREALPFIHEWDIRIIV